MAGKHARGGWVLGLVLLNCALAAPLRAAPTTRPAHTPFVTVLLRDWDRWDTNHDGQLSIAEIDRAVLDPSVKGDDAAAAGTLKLLSRSTKVTVPPLTRDYFLDYDQKAISRLPRITAAAAETATADTVASQVPTTGPSVGTKTIPIRWDVYFMAGQKRIARGGPTTWPTKPSLDNMRQGPLGDCFLVAPIGSMLVHRPADIDQIIKRTDDGGYRVTFPTVQPFTLRPLTESELVLSSTSSGDGVWLAALEQAVGRYDEKLKASSDEEGTDIISGGGRVASTMSLLTGHRCKSIRFATTAQRREENEARILPSLRQELVSALHDGRLIAANVTPPVLKPTTQPTTGPAVVSAVVPAVVPTVVPVTQPSQPTLATTAGPTTAPTTRPTGRLVLTAAMLPKIPPNITTKHSYAVVGYDPATDVVEIWNPHGQAFTPKGSPGLENGYPTVHGRFHLPLPEAYQFFTSFVFETSAPATQPTTAPAGRPRVGE
jgi:hypothetical protein